MVFFCLLIFTSCGNKDKAPSGILKPDKMQAVLWDIIKAEALTGEILKKDSTKNATEEDLMLQKKVFAIHQVTRENFYKSLDYYKTHPGQLKEMMDSMIIQAEKNRYKNFNIKPVQAN
jgi:hypothetical protein